MKPLERAGQRLELKAPVALDTHAPARPFWQSRRPATITTTPDLPPPSLICPNCHAALAYRQTVITGGQPIERWDYFKCRTCGPFVYRDRTRTLRPAT